MTLEQLERLQEKRAASPYNSPEHHLYDALISLSLDMPDTAKECLEYALEQARKEPPQC